MQALLAAAVLVALAHSAPAQRQFEELAKRGLPADQDWTAAVARGDVDGDGDFDLVFGNSGRQNRLYLNDGSGIFTDATTGRMPVDNDFTTCAAVGDVDGDGDLDLVFGNDGQQNRLCLNNGTGTFTDATAARMPVDTDATVAVALGDVDDDGDLDLVFGNRDQQNRLYLNNGTGTFTDATAARMPVDIDYTTCVALGDVDGDGDLDLVFGNTWSSGNSGQNRLYLNDGTGTFLDETSDRMPVDNDGTFAVAMGDVDGDGDGDLVFGNDGQNRLYLNDGTGTFTDVTAACMPVDIDRTYAVAMGDVDGDGDRDLVFGNRPGSGISGQNRLYLNNGTGTFTDATAARMPVDNDDTTCEALDDFDGDGDLDLVFGNWNQRNRLYLNNGTGTFTDATAARLPVAANGAVALGDVDGDGDLDLVVGNFGQNRLYLNNGTGTFTDATTARMPVDNDTTTCVALGDVDGDGDLDLVFGNFGFIFTGGQNRLYLNDGTGTFTDVTATRMPVDIDFTTCVAFGDVDGDLDLDLVFGNTAAQLNQNRLYLNNGMGTFTDVTATHMPVDNDWTTCVALGDVDGDGDRDLVFGNTNSQQNRLYRNNGTGTFTDVTATSMPVDHDGTGCVALGDVDGDGDRDLVFGNFPLGWASGQNRLYLNNGMGTFTDATAARMPVDNDTTGAGALGDVDGDGDLDLVFANGGYPNPQNRLYLNNGTGTFADVTAARMPVDNGTFGALGDVDGDGDVDLVGSRLHLNLLRQLDAPFLLRVGHSYQLDVYARYGPPRWVDVALPFLSTGTATIPLPPLGTLGIDPNNLIPLPAFVIQPAAGVGSVTITVPNIPGLAGMSIYGQALLIQYPTQDRLTNVTADVIWN